MRSSVYALLSDENSFKRAVSTQAFFIEVLLQEATRGSLCVILTLFQGFFASCQNPLRQLSSRIQALQLQHSLALMSGDKR